jgi:SSS family solute:Na+ symporter
MISFSSLDLVIIFIFFIVFPLIGFLSARNQKNNVEDYLLSGRKVNLFLYVLTTVSTWYGGILGVGEFSYRYGLASWFTQGFPYYLFAFLFAIFFAKKIRASSLFTIPEKLTQAYGKKVGIVAAILVFILVTPAPYFLMIGNIISLIFNIPILYSILIAMIFTTSYLVLGGYKSDLYTDVFFFFVMFGGLILALVTVVANYGGIDFLFQNLPPAHLSLTGGASPIFIVVWFLIALWTFADPGFHQRTYSAKNGNVAVKGLLISIIFWALFDLLTNGLGLYARAVLPNLENPVNSYLLLAEKVLGSGVKGFFLIAMLATILSTLNSLLFLSGTTIGKDFFHTLSKNKDDIKIIPFTVYGILISSLLSLTLALLIPSVIQIWYTVGSLCIPGLIFLIIGSFYPKFMTDKKYALIEMVAAVTSSSIWYFIKNNFISNKLLIQIEPMIVGLLVAFMVHMLGLGKSNRH